MLYKFLFIGFNMALKSECDPQVFLINQPQSGIQLFNHASSLRPSTINLLPRTAVLLPIQNRGKTGVFFKIITEMSGLIKS